MNENKITNVEDLNKECLKLANEPLRNVTLTVQMLRRNPIEVVQFQFLVDKMLCQNNVKYSKILSAFSKSLSYK